VAAVSRHDWVYALLAPPLLLATPFVSFVNFNGYSYAAPEIWISLAGLIAAGLLFGVILIVGGRWVQVITTAGLVTLFADIQFDWIHEQPRIRVLGFGISILLLGWLIRDRLSRVTTAFFGTMLIAILILPTTPAELSSADQGPTTDVRTVSKPTPPVIVHLILDEFIGVEGIPSDVPNGTEIRNQLRNFLLVNDFHLFGRSYSHFVMTRDSVPNTLNYTSIPINKHFIGKENNLIENKYFLEMYNKGDSINVYQTDYMDFCKNNEIHIKTCRTFVNTGIKPIQNLSVSPISKAKMSLATFLRRSLILKKINSIYLNIRPKMGVLDNNLPATLLPKYNLAPIRGLHTLMIMANDVANSSAGEFFFVHVLFPHGPYLFDRHCDLRDIQNQDLQSRSRSLDVRERYGLYLEQILCVRAALGDMFDKWRRAGKYDRIKIVIQGDHGARIFFDEPSDAERLLIRPGRYPPRSAYVDAFRLCSQSKRRALSLPTIRVWWRFRICLCPWRRSGRLISFLRARPNNTSCLRMVAPWCASPCQISATVEECIGSISLDPSAGARRAAQKPKAALRGADRVWGLGTRSVGWYASSTRHRAPRGPTDVAVGGSPDRRTRPGIRQRQGAVGAAKGPGLIHAAQQ
jgi:hypothetical protein